MVDAPGEVRNRKPILTGCRGRGPDSRLPASCFHPGRRLTGTGRRCFVGPTLIPALTSSYLPSSGGRGAGMSCYIKFSGTRHL